MIWLYYTKAWPAEKVAAQQVYLRAVSGETEEELMVSNMIEANIFAMDFYFALEENPLADEKHQKIYYERLPKKQYYIEEVATPEDYVMKRFTMFLKTDAFSKDEMLDWLKVYLAIQGFEWTAWQESDLSAFYELNPILRLFSLDNVQKFEDELGKDWWKKDQE
jgi:hypothetical protein